MICFKRASTKPDRLHTGTSMFKSSFNKENTRTIPGADMGSDHDLVFTTIEDNLKLFKNKRAISFISHISKSMLRIILNRLKSTAEELPVEGQA
ncbi:hypothetical protein DPMN_194533 [Dreissena polymorpha]|uniref:Uncharacterized protein n=1 Tax=Dreissena polymorpha TaxID=45954 RepID=A0A9D3Y3Z8_DREPO|nr:hypothetical protein DPMN_194533 [Dreissena polymorpha]